MGGINAGDLHLPVREFQKAAKSAAFDGSDQSPRDEPDPEARLFHRPGHSEIV